MSKKYEHLYKVDKEKDDICFAETGHVYTLSQLKKAEVISKKILKNTGKEFASAVANSLVSGFYGSGNEKAVVILRLTFPEGKEEVLMSDKVYTKGNLDYYEMMEETRALKEKFKRHIVTPK